MALSIDSVSHTDRSSSILQTRSLCLVIMQVPWYHYKTYLKQPGISEKNRPLALRNIRNCEFAIEAVKKPVLFNPESVGPGINTEDDEYWPSITADGQTLMFTRQVYTSFARPVTGGTQEDFYVSYSDGDKWGEGI